MNNTDKTIKICHGHKCKYLGEHIFSRLESDMAQNPAKKVILKKCQCRGMCAEGPIVIEEKSGKTEIHKKMDPMQAAKLL
jgi:NADH:ubiquinone oxidoreductase subunit E